MRCCSTSPVSADCNFAAQWAVFHQLHCGSVLVKFQEVFRIENTKSFVLIEKMVTEAFGSLTWRKCLRKDLHKTHAQMMISQVRRTSCFCFIKSTNYFTQSSKCTTFNLRVLEVAQLRFTDFLVCRSDISSSYWLRGTSYFLTSPAKKKHSSCIRAAQWAAPTLVVWVWQQLTWIRR